MKDRSFTITLLRTHNIFDIDNEVDSNKIEKINYSKKKSWLQMAKSKNLVWRSNFSKSNNTKLSKLDLCLIKTRPIIISLRHVFVEALILWYFYLKC